MEGLNRLGIGAYTSQAPPAIIQPANQTIEQEVAAMQQLANTLMLNVATNRKQIYDLIVQLKDHHHKYGFESPAKAIEAVIKRSKTWANAFIAEIEVELGLRQRVQEVASSTPKKPTENRSLKSSVTNGLDKTGLPIPEELLSVAVRRKDVKKVLHHAAKLHAFFQGLQDAQDDAYRHLYLSGNVQTFTSGCSQMHYQISECLPDVVCPVCQGKRELAGKLCHECSGSGFISKHHWHHHWVKARDENKQAEVKRRAEQGLPAES